MSNFNCCQDFRDALNIPSISTFRVESNGVLFLNVGSTKSGEEINFYDQAVIFCPFCGTKLQDRHEIALKMNAENLS
jgi:hypothetical protein